MEIAPTRSEMLRDVMRLAHEKQYHGEGDLWGWMSQDRENALASGEYVEVLRSEAFCRAFWRIELLGGIRVGPNPPTDLIYDTVADEQITAWSRHHEALKTAEDPLAYCYRELP
jgi:hypothetical protein